MKFRILFLPKLFPRENIIGGPILVYHRIKNLSKMGNKITVIAPIYDEEDEKDESLNRFCEEVIKVRSKKEKTKEEIEKALQKT